MKLNELPAIGQTVEGGIFAGLTTTKDGEHCAVILLEDKPGNQLTWEAAMKWAETLNAALPTRPVSALLFANLGDSFEKDWHWTSESWDGSYAWTQDFYYGYQNGNLKSSEGRARAVRLIQLTA